MENKHYEHDSAESLARSHSKSSNAKLTLLCIGAVIALSLAVVSVALALKLNQPLVYIASVGCLVLFFLFCLGFSKFKR